MSELVRAPVATIDWLPPRVALRQLVVDTAVRVFERAGFGQVVTPTFEDTALFARTAGDASDIVSKEMYSFADRGGREVTLRPEGTAPVVRAYLEHGQAREPQPVKLWYVAPMFRYARAQRGRYREHWQFGVESLGSEDPAVDAEVIALQAAWYRELGLLDRLVLELNSIGDSACRPAYRALLVEYLERFRSELSEDSQARLDVNPLRVFDSKDEGDQRIVSGAPVITDHLCEACAEHFAGVRAFLDARGLAYAVTPRLVRGIDYYERTAWEWVIPGGGSQAGSISGGGRYDGLAEQIGGDRVPGVGFGCGTERMVLALEDAGVEPPQPVVDWFIACEDDAARPQLHALLEQGRARGLAGQADLAGRSLKGQLRHAERLRARVVTVCRAGDGARGIVRHGESEIALGDVVDYVERSVRGQ
ncbi:MAG: histidine--tRNA ligase [Actinomycetota bacterium]|nr:histidine--tRNA ligase [Actinomycetota bacterium]